MNNKFKQIKEPLMRLILLVILIFTSITSSAFADTTTKSSHDCQHSNSNGNKEILGAVEWVKVDSVGEVMKARIDTGATTSSISAVDIHSYDKDGKKRVKFKLAHNNYESAEIDTPVIRSVRIIQASISNFERRYVVELPITIGKLTQFTKFTLRNRKHLTYPILLGRSYLDGTAVVDVSEKYIQGKP